LPIGADDHYKKDHCAGPGGRSTGGPRGVDVAPGIAGQSASAGNASGADALSATFSGTYTINNDCTGSAIYKDSLGQTFHENLVVMDRGNEIAVIVTEAGSAIAFVDVRQ
jgi:hypothetical protein